MAALLAACAVAPAPRDPATAAAEVLAMLAAGDIDAAATAVARARRAFPEHGGIAAASAAVADLLWRDELAVAEWRAVAASRDRAGWSAATARGRLGDQLFAAGRYGESVVHLVVGQSGDGFDRRRSLAAVARALPYKRRQAGPIVCEQPLLDDQLPEFPCTIGSLQRAFAVDTGSSITAIAASLAGEIGLPVLVDAGEIADGTGRPVPARLGVLESFAVGDIWLGSVPTLVVDDERLAMRDLFGGPERTPIGVLGLDLMSMFRMTLDPVRKSLQLERPRGLPEATSVQCVRSDGRCLVPVAIEGRRLWFVLDTGASHSSLTPEGLEALPGAERRAVPGFRRVRTAGGGVVSVREVQNVVVRVSQARFPGVDLPVVDRGPAALFPVHGVLGIDLMRQCRVTLDRGRARIEPGQ